VPRQYRRSLRGFIVCAAVSLVLAGVAGADTQISFVDRAGDAGSSVDITGVRVSSWGDGSEGGVGVEATVVPNRFWCGGDGGDLPLLIAIDTDQNPDTGSAFYGAEVELEYTPPRDAREGEPVFLRANGWGFKVDRFPYGGMGLECGRTIGGYFIDTAALGITPTSGFNVVAATISPSTLLQTSAPSTTSRSPGRRRRSSGPTLVRRTSSPIPPRPFTAGSQR
jgi:hypothetical protein